jgi:hypothetical protein
LGGRRKRDCGGRAPKSGHWGWRVWRALHSPRTTIPYGSPLQLHFDNWPSEAGLFWAGGRFESLFLVALSLTGRSQHELPCEG